MRRLATVVSLILIGLSGCTLLSEPEKDFSCTDEGVRRTAQVADEIHQTLDLRVPAVGERTHGCDSTPSGYYDVDQAEVPRIVEAFACRPHARPDRDPNTFTCRADRGPFRLYLSLEEPTATIEVIE